MTTTYLVRTDTTQVPTSDDARLLHWAPGRPEATIQTVDITRELFRGHQPPRVAADLLLLGAAVYCADKATLRRHTPDFWTRDITIDLPVGDAETWREAGFDHVLRFLSGDHWRIEPRYSDRHPLTADRPAQRSGIDAVCLFSGGLDSLCGAVDLLEQDTGTRLALLSHNEGGQASTAQKRLLAELVDHYGSHRLVHHSLFLRPAPVNGKQVRPLPTRRENTTRSRSLLFLTTALALAAAEGPDVPVYVPENGFIGINVPLTRARVGSASTRTTHPHYMRLLSDAVTRLGIRNPILNPYRLLTKGEMLEQSRNPDLLHRLTPQSLSCSHPEAARFFGGRQGNCGYCFPCLIRRASLHHVGWDDDSYAVDIFNPADQERLRKRRGADLRAVIAGAFVDHPDRDVLRNGPIPDRERAAFTGVWRRGLDELRTWLTSRGHDALDHLPDPRP